MDLQKHDDDKEQSFVDLEKKNEIQKEKETENIYDETCFYDSTNEIKNDNNTTYSYTETNNMNMSNQMNMSSQQTDQYEIIALIFGILSLLCCCFGGLALPIGIIGIIFSVLAKNKNQTLSNVGIAAIICSVLGTVISLIMLVFSIVSIIAAGGLAGYIEQLEETNRKNGISMAITLKNFLSLVIFK